MENRRKAHAKPRRNANFIEGILQDGNVPVILGKRRWHALIGFLIIVQDQKLPIFGYLDTRMEAFGFKNEHIEGPVDQNMVYLCYSTVHIQSEIMQHHGSRRRLEIEIDQICGFPLGIDSCPQHAQLLLDLQSATGGGSRSQALELGNLVFLWVHAF